MFAHYFKRNHPLLPRFNRLLADGPAFELAYRVRRRYLWKNDLVNPDYNDFEPLKLSTMTAILRFLFGMWAFSGLAFVIELNIFFFSRRAKIALKNSAKD